MVRIRFPQNQLLAAVDRIDITPPVGIYHRMWGAALHDQATGVHRPLTATLLWMASVEGEADHLLISLDHCILDTREIRALQKSIAEASGIAEKSVQILVTHTHGSGWMSRSRSEYPGGELIGGYLDTMNARVTECAGNLKTQIQPAAIVFGTGHCSLAAHRDFHDPDRGHAVCGFNPDGAADDTVLVGRLTDSSNRTMAVLVNYACHPTTLAWDNTLLSPDWVGAMRETVENAAGGLCLFLQGASGDLGPREGFVGDTSVADRNGRQLGYAVLSALEQIPAPGTDYVYQGPVLSGTWIGTWAHIPCDASVLHNHVVFRWETITVELPYRHDLPSIEDTVASQSWWREQEVVARDAGDADRIRECRAQCEQMTRQLTRLKALAPGRTCPLPVSLAILGDSIWVFVPGELYQLFQTALRARFPDYAVLVVTLAGDWQPGYIPPAATYGYVIYQEIIAATSAGSLELLIEAATRELRRLLSTSRR